MNHGADVVDGDLEKPAIDAENMMLAFVPFAVAGDGIEVPRAHLAGGERQAAALLALHEPQFEASSSAVRSLTRRSSSALSRSSCRVLR